MKACGTTTSWNAPFQYEELSPSEALAAIKVGLEPLDEEELKEPLQEWREDLESLTPEHAIAAAVADLN